EWRVAEDNNPFADGRHVFATGLDGTDFVVLNLKTDHTFVTATSREQQQKNALFSAAANPATILALLSERRKMVEALEPFGHYYRLNDLHERSDDDAIEVPVRDLRRAAALTGSREHG